MANALRERRQRTRRHASGPGAAAGAAPRHENGGWRRRRRVAPPPAPAEPPSAPAGGRRAALLDAVAAATALVKAFRTHGHLAARLDPLGSEPVGDPALEPESVEPDTRADGADSRVRPARVRARRHPRRVLPHLRETYCGTMAYEIEHISNHEERVWLRQAIESGRYRSRSRPRTKRRGCSAPHPGRGLRAVPPPDVPRPEAVLDRGARRPRADARRGDRARGRGRRARGRDRDGAPWPAQRARAHDRRPVREILREFEGERTIEAVAADPEGGSGDVKYHLGAEGTRTTPAGEITVMLAPNPSHLEAVDPVVEGGTRAGRPTAARRRACTTRRVALPLLIHGDASFPARESSPRRSTSRRWPATRPAARCTSDRQQPGRLHDRSPARAARRATRATWRRASTSPIIHVNADDPEAAISATRLAMAFRQRFGTTSSSTSSATAATATTSRTSRRTRSR